MGYFALGWPKKFPLYDATTSGLPSDDEILSLKMDPTNQYLLVLTSTCIQIWSSGSIRLRLASLQLIPSPDNQTPHNTIVSGSWASPSSHSNESDFGRFLICLKNGTLFAISISHQNASTSQSNASDSLLYSFFNSSSTTSTTQSNTNHHSITLTLLHTFQLFTTPSTVTAVHSAINGVLIGDSSSTLSYILLYHNNSSVTPSSFTPSVAWSCNVTQLLSQPNALHTLGVPLKDSPSSNTSTRAIIDMEFCQELNMVGIVLENGVSLILGTYSCELSESAPSIHHGGRWLRGSQSSSIAFEPQKMLVSVGLSTGDIEHYYVGVPAGDLCPIVRRFSLSGWYFEPNDVGPAVVLKWSADGTVLAVGWKLRGLALWSSSGCRLMWTLPQIGGTLPMSARGMSSLNSANNNQNRYGFQHPMESGVQDIEWGPRGLFLWAAARKPLSFKSDSRRVEREFVEFALMKSGNVGGSCQNEATRLCMIGSDRLLFLRTATTGSTTANPSNTKNNSSLEHSVNTSSSHRNSANAAERGSSSADSLDWQHIPYPSEYLTASHWPPRMVAVNDSFNCIALAGTQSVSICNPMRSLPKWKLLVNSNSSTNELDSIKVCALAWFRSVLVLGVELVDSKTNQLSYEIHFYSKDLNFETSKRLKSKALSAKPLLFDVRIDGYLLVLCTDSLMILFKLSFPFESQDQSTLLIQEVYQMFLPTRTMRQFPNATSDNIQNNLIPSPGGGISAVRLYPPITAFNEESLETIPAPTKVILLRTTGSLVLLDVKRMLSMPLLRNVDHLWLTNTHRPPFEKSDQRPLWWAYGDDGLHVSFIQNPSKSSVDSASLSHSEVTSHSAAAGRSSALSFQKEPLRVSVESWFDLDPEVYPLGLMLEYGMVLGACQGLGYEMSYLHDALPCHLIRVKRQPVLHTMLRHLLLQGAERRALEAALKCVGHPQFVDSLEWLLYEAVQDHERTTGASNDEKIHQELLVNTSDGDLFPRVLRLLRYFGEYEDIVVRCARKMEAKRWPLLFSLAGEPAALLEQCFTSGRLYTAACLLVILQEMWGFVSSTPHSLRLLDAALQRHEFALANELSNFLLKADRAGMLTPKHVRIQEDVSWIESAALSRVTHRNESAEKRMNSRVRSSAIDARLLVFLRNAFGQSEYRAIVAVCAKFEFPLSHLIAREPWLIAHIQTHWNESLLRLHRQFHRNEPQIESVTAAFHEFVSNSNKNQSRQLYNDPKLTALVSMSIHDPRFEQQFVSSGGGGSSHESRLSQCGRMRKCDERLTVVQDELMELELIYLQNECREFGEDGRNALFLLVSTVLLDVSSMIAVLKTLENEKRNAFLNGLRDLDSNGYDQLAHSLHQWFSKQEH